jgi:hypothetical protein
MDAGVKKQWKDHERRSYILRKRFVDGDRKLLRILSNAMTSPKKSLLELKYMAEWWQSL